MNIKMATNSKLSTTESKKKKLSEQLEQEQNHIMEIIWRVISWKGKDGGKSIWIKNIIGRYKIDRGRLRIV